MSTSNPTTIPISGMHCRSCELLLEGAIREVPEVKSVKVSQKTGCAVINSGSQTLNYQQIEKVIIAAGYQVSVAANKPWFSKSIDNYLDLFYVIFALGVLYLMVNILGLQNIFSTTNSDRPSSLITVLIIGLTAGFSTCMALVGGLVLGASARFAEKHPEADGLTKFKPHLFFNAGRIISYTLLGGLIGLVGSSLQLSGFSLGLMTLAVALVMLTLGLQLTKLFPRLDNFKFILPPGIARKLGIQNQNNKDYSDANSMVLGGLTFFLPCGFTQAMQLYAMSTGNFTQGALIMGLFALGTAPGILGIGGLTSAFKGQFAQKFFKFAGVVVVILAIINFRNGLNLLGWSPGIISLPNTGVSATGNVDLERQDGSQIIRMTQSNAGYTPNRLNVVKGVPVKWIITADAPNSCSASLIASKIGVRQFLNPGENVIEFTPQEVGTIPFSCSMGMYRGTIEVTEKL